MLILQKAIGNWVKKTGSGYTVATTVRYFRTRYIIIIWLVFFINIYCLILKKSYFCGWNEIRMSGLNLNIKDVFINVSFLANCLINIILPPHCPFLFIFWKKILKVIIHYFFLKNQQSVFLCFVISLLYIIIKCKY